MEEPNFYDMNKVLLFLVGFVLLITSCKENNKEDLDPYILLTAKVWKPALYDKNPETSPQGKNIYRAITNCMKDDNYSFSTSNKLTINRGLDMCDGDELKIEVSDFILDVARKQIVIKGNVYILAEVSPTQLKYYAPIPAVSDYSNLIYIFEH